MPGRRKKGRKGQKKRNQTVNTVVQRIVAATESCFERRKRNLQISELASGSEDVAEKSCLQEVEIKDNLEQKMSKYRITVSEKISTDDVYSYQTKSLVRGSNNIPILVNQPQMGNIMKGIFSEYSHMMWLIPYMSERDEDASTNLVMNDPVSTELIINDPTIEGNEEQPDRECTLVRSTINTAITEEEEENLAYAMKRKTEVDIFRVCAEIVDSLIDAAAAKTQEQQLSRECEPFVQSILDAVIIGIEQEETDSKQKADDAFEVCTNLVKALVDDAVAESQEEQMIVHCILDEALNKIDEDEADKERIEDEDALEMGKILPVPPTCSPQLPSFFSLQHFEDFELEPAESTPTCFAQLPPFFNSQHFEDFELEPAESTPICCSQLPSFFNSQHFEDFELEPAESTPTCCSQLPSFFNSQHFEDFELEPAESAPTCCSQLPSFFNSQHFEDFELEPAESTPTCSSQLPPFFNSQHFEDFELEPAESMKSLRLLSFFEAKPNLPSFFSAIASDNLPSSVYNLSFPSGSAGSPEFSAIQPVVSQSINAVHSLATGLPSLSWDDVEYVTSRQGDATILGSGTYATVYLARQRSCGRLVAVKEFKEGIPCQEILNEPGIIHALAGTGFVPELVGVIIPAFDNWSPCIVQDYFGGGKTLEALLYGEGEASFPKELWFSILHQLSLAIKSFCYHKIIHNDLKPDNILVDVSDLQDVKVKVIDFGLATKGRGYIFRGTQEKFARCPHMAPEAKQGRFTTVASDVYSLGHIFNEMAKLAPSIFPIAFRCTAENSNDRPSPDEVNTFALQLLS